MIGVPISPLIIEVSDVERAALHSAKGGRTTDDDSEEGRMFASFWERGMVKTVTTGAGWTARKLSGDGLTLAYSDEGERDLWHRPTAAELRMSSDPP